MRMKNVRIGNIRAFAIVLVVIGHSIILYTGWGIMETTRTIPNIIILKKFINLLEMPLFMSVSGYVFFYSMKKKKEFPRFVYNKAKRVLIPFLFVGTFWMTPIRMLMNIKGWEKGFFVNIWENLILQKSVGHLWYLISLFLIFVFFYGVIWLLNRLQCTVSMDLLVLVFTFFVSMVAKENILFPLGVISVKRFFMYLFWFFLGYLMNKYSDGLTFIKGKERKYVSVLSAVLFIIFFAIECEGTNEITYYAAAFFGVIAVYSCMPDKTNKVVSVIEKNSYGLYLFHSPMIYITFTFLLEKNPYIVVFINIIGLGIISIVLTCLLRRTPLAFVIGEKCQNRSN